MTDRMKPRAALSAAWAVLRSFLATFRDDLLEALGVLLIVVGVAMWSLPVALIIAGIAVLLIVHPLPVRRRS
ncbi:hypothetical protein QE418_000620 [Microbacterium testaceum]|uniref:hypothetical protein n=1 Tax=Microbacterium TaxID=33882 RepID=UPI002786BBAD|nr:MULTISPECIES: hypothetical protein [Microbacterium]MDQ1111172.1 hypothetical protein [Microbacterium testaceum]MDR6098289.1 hypothetical protein [Microbacterium sp. SORGH_AS_0454]